TTPPASYEIDVLARHLSALCAELGDGSCHVVGHDWGGIIGAAAASLHPQALRSITLVCCAHPAAFSSGLRKPAQVMRSWYVGMFQIPGLEHVLGHRAFVERVAGDADIHDAEGMRRALAYYRTNLRPWRLARSAAGRIAQPGLVIHAERDLAITEQLMRASASFLDDLRGFEIIDSGHFIHREKPTALLEILLPFLRDNSPSG
ncbi:MAG: alpha/beta hydrolase, partial [Actinomycetota bacterium]|nr:alpha/beta hydrolase [Actinomycetota bacterium]